MPVGRHRRVAAGSSGIELVAADAGDLLGDVGLDDEVAPPGRDDRDERLRLARVDLERLRRRRRRATRVPAGAGSVAMPTRASSGAAARPSDRPMPSRRSTRAGRNGDAGRRRARSGSCRRRRSRPVPPAHSLMSRAVRSAPSRASRCSWPFSKRRLASERRRVAERRAADADRVEDGRLDDDVGRRVGDLGRGAAHDAGDPERSRRVGDEQRVRVELAIDVVERLDPLARRAPGGRRSGRRGRPPRRTCGSACRARASRSCSRRRRC